MRLNPGVFSARKRSVKRRPKNYTWDSVEFVIPGNPIPKARPRVVEKVDRAGRVRRMAYTPKSTAAYEESVKAAYPYNGPQFDGIVLIEMDFFRRDRIRADWDNLAKAVTDALNGRAWDDDSQIRAASVRVYRGDGNPRAVVKIRGQVSE